MAVNTDVERIQYGDTLDKDLVQLGGYHAYHPPEELDTIKVNGKYFRVENSIYDAKTGLNALTVRNVDDVNYEDLTIVFVGSQQLEGDWINTNMNLLGEDPPAQIAAAKDYFKDVNENIGNVTSVTGNSLAGALTNAVGMENPDVKAVTLNPAILPEGMVDPNKTYPNITNYYSEFDALTNGQKALGIDAQIPGNKYSINNGLPLFDMMGSNHTGYVKRDKHGNFTVEVGKKGEPGHGHIHVGADNHIVTSIWTGQPLYGGVGERIKIDKAFMDELASGIQDQVAGRLNIAVGYMENAYSIVQGESNQFNQRVSKLQDIFQSLFNELAGEPMLHEIANKGVILKAIIDELIGFLYVAEDKCRFLNSILNSKPMELIEFVTSVDISVESLFSSAKNHLNNLNTDVDNLVAYIQDIIMNDIPDLFEGGKDSFIDAVVGEMDAHYAIIDKNNQKVASQLNDYSLQVQDIANAFYQKDLGVANAIHSNSKASPIANADNVQHMNVFTIETSDYLQQKMKIKEIKVERSFNKIKSIVTTVVTPVLIIINNLLAIIESTLESIITAINSALNAGLYGNPLGIAVSIFSDYDQKIKAAVHAAKKPIEEMENTITSLRNGLDHMIANLPGMIDDFKPYLASAIFEPSKFRNVRLYNIATVALLDEMGILFNDIIYQLSSAQAESVKATLQVSKSVQGNMQILNEQVERGTL